MSVMRTAGIAIGIMVGLIIVVFVLKAINKDGKMKTEYDERQKIVRGEAYMYGFYALIISLVAEFMVDSAVYDVSKLGITEFVAPILIGIITQVTYSIFNDGYEGINTNMTKFIVVMIVVTLINFLSGFGSIFNEGLFRSDVLNDSFVNILVGGMGLILMIELMIKKGIESGA
ncbi:hypothetical protein [Eubacterium xylanophilum]|uniref:hypothetical protein n=1 Tax=Eubacterium xylanophilum TaxID=39497 RepID=UPI001A983A40|nr:hypothetical protein [Eubacterium xylanophilum]